MKLKKIGKTGLEQYANLPVWQDVRTTFLLSKVTFISHSGSSCTAFYLCSEASVGLSHTPSSVQ